MLHESTNRRTQALPAAEASIAASIKDQLRPSRQASGEAQALQESLGKVGPQPLCVHSYTNRRFTINFRVPILELQRLLPQAITAEEVGSTGEGILSMCACDFWVSRIGVFRLPAIRNNDMLCRVSVQLRQGGKRLRAFYTVHSVSSSALLAALGKRFSHFRKRKTAFTRIDDGVTYALESKHKSPLSCGRIRASIASLSHEPPLGSVFRSSEDARDFLFQIDGSCGYQWETGRMSFQTIEYPAWDIRFCHEVEYSLPLIDELVRRFGLHCQYDSTVEMHDTPQVWCATRLYYEDGRDCWSPPRSRSSAMRKCPSAEPAAE